MLAQTLLNSEFGGTLKGVTNLKAIHYQTVLQIV